MISFFSWEERPLLCFVIPFYCTWEKVLSQRADFFSVGNLSLSVNIAQPFLNRAFVPLLEDPPEECDKRCDKSVVLIKLLKFSEHQFPLVSKPPVSSLCVLCVGEPLDSVSTNHQITHRFVSLPEFSFDIQVSCTYKTL